MRLLLVFLLSIICSNTTNGGCYYARHPSVPADSCKQILDVQSECYGESGWFWIKQAGGGIESVYCDMHYKGGGWRRALYFHSAINDTCPAQFVTEIIHGRPYCRKEPGVKELGTLDYVITVWNYDQSVQFTEVRGYVKLRVRYNFSPDGFKEDLNSLMEYGHIDGFEFFTTYYPALPHRQYFSYVIGSTTTSRCPINGGTGESGGQPSYRDNIFACDEIDLSGPMDSDGFYLQELFGPTCVQCPAGSPWFEQRFPGPLAVTRIYGRIVNTESSDDGIYLTDMELYVR